jgi:hypothetical protein
MGGYRFEPLAQFPLNLDLFPQPGDMKPACGGRVAMWQGFSLRPTTSHNFSSTPPEATVVPSGLNARQLTQPVCACKQAPSCRSDDFVSGHIFIM